MAHSAPGVDGIEGAVSDGRNIVQQGPDGRGGEVKVLNFGSSVSTCASCAAT